MAEVRQLVTSADGQWVAARRGREVELLAGGAAPSVGRLELDRDDVDLALIGPPTVLAVVSRGAANEGGKLVVHHPPYLDAVARLDLELPSRIAAVTGPRLALVSTDQRQLTIVRVAGRALASQVLVVEGPIEFVVGLEKHQLLLGLLRKLEVWDAVSGRPLRRMQLQLPAAPRTVGAAHGHVWTTQPDSDELCVYRLSDGRPFRHNAGSPIERVICHPSSPVLVLVTARGMLRLHCFAHALTPLDVPVSHALAQLPIADDIALIGLSETGGEPWRLSIGGGSTATAPETDGRRVELAEPSEAEGKPRAARQATPSPTDAPKPRAGGRGDWREPLATFGTELARSADAEIPIVAVDTELGDLVHRLKLPAPARRALIALYSLHVIGEPELSISRLAHALGDWTEPLGTGDLGALGMLRRRDGKVALHAAVTDLIDGAAPRAIRLTGGAATTPRAGASRVARDGRSDSEIETELAAQLGRIAMIEGPHDTLAALIEARLHGATAVTFVIPAERPHPWPRGAGLVLVLHGSPASWVADLPSLATDATVA